MAEDRGNKNPLARNKKKAFATSGEVRTHALNEDQNLSLAP